MFSDFPTLLADFLTAFNVSEIGWYIEERSFKLITGLHLLYKYITGVSLHRFSSFFRQTYLLHKHLMIDSLLLHGFPVWFTLLV